MLILAFSFRIQYFKWKSLILAENGGIGERFSALHAKMQPPVSMSRSSCLFPLLLYGNPKNSPVEEKETKPHH
jgi:hypothetical protein